MVIFSPEQILENLYGGPSPDPKSVRRWLKKAELTLPVSIVAIELQNHDPGKLKFTNGKLKTWIIKSDHGMLYISYNGPEKKMLQLLDRQSLLHGENLVCETPTQWMEVLRQAIGSVRQRYLSLMPDANPENFTLSAELEHRQIAINAFQNEKDWIESIMPWADIVLMRNQDNLSNLRRKWVEFLSLATENIDQDDRLSFFYIQAIRQILHIYAFSDFHRIIPKILSDLHPYMILDKTQHVLSRHTYPETIQKALNVIHESYTDPISLSDISARCFVSHEHLARTFKHATGYTVTEFLQLLRVDHARQMLTETNKGILDIAFDSGFNTVEHFHRIFKKHTKLTPLRYRKAHQLL